jgi:hypothetical protein
MPAHDLCGHFSRTTCERGTIREAKPGYQVRDCAGLSKPAGSVSTMQSTRRRNLRFRAPQIIACIAIAIAEACSSAESGNRGALPMSSFTADRSASPAESAQASQAGGKGGVLDGVWKGTTTAYCSELRFQGRCNAQQKSYHDFCRARSQNHRRL